MPAIKLVDLPHAGNSHRLEGCRHGDVPASLIFFDGPPGSGSKLHHHPYPEVFVMQSGQATFMVDGEEIAAQAGDILIAPAGTSHKFTNTGDEPLRVLGIHLNARFTQFNEE
jgi:mannose-6-phosphate isomerase-like protein (cupin superfamily)